MSRKNSFATLIFSSSLEATRPCSQSPSVTTEAYAQRIRVTRLGATWLWLKKSVTRHAEVAHAALTSHFVNRADVYPVW